MTEIGAMEAQLARISRLAGGADIRLEVVDDGEVILCHVRAGGTFQLFSDRETFLTAGLSVTQALDKMLDKVTVYHTEKTKEKE